MLKALTLDNFWAPFAGKVKFVEAKKSENVDFRFLLAIGFIVLNVGLLFAYIYGVNNVANEGYQIKVLQSRLKDIDDANKKINLKISEATSMVAIQSDFLSANFVPAGTSKFLQAGPNQFTQR